MIGQSSTHPAMTEADEMLADAVLRAMQNSRNMRVWTDALDIRARDGVIHLSGHVRTHAEKEIMHSVIMSVRGVRDIVSNVYVDTDLEIAVAQALGRDPRTRDGFPGILVGSAFGEIHLKGNVASQEIKQAAGQIAGQVPGVRGVINKLEAPEPPKAPAPAKPAAGAAAKPPPKPAPTAASEGGSESDLAAE